MSNDTETVKVKTTWFEALWKMAVVIGLAANFFLRSTFVSADTYNADREKTQLEIQKLTSIVQIMQEADKVNDRQDYQLQDHESRLRALEHRK